jgi:two-component system nitrogen regulation sensor histidine kinase GlnL
LNYQPVLDALSTSVFVLDDRCRVDYLNESAESLVDESLTRLRGQEIGEILELAYANEAETCSKNSIRDTCLKPISDGLEIRLHDVEIIFYSTRRSYRLDCFVHCCEFSGWGGVVLEVAGHGKRNLIADSARPAPGHNVVRGLAHEIRNPLGGIRGAAQLLRNEVREQELAQYTDLIIDEADRLARLVGKMQASTVVRQKQALNIHTVIEHVRALVESESNKGTVIQTDYDPSLPDVCGDSDQLTQAFLNIALNALEAADGGGGTVVLRSRIDRRGLPESGFQQVIRVDIEDDGPGVDEELADRVFDPMVSGKPQGTGLGLSITAEIVRNHGGLIVMDSVPGKTVFSVYLRIGGDSCE